ncbi:MAG: histidine kinase dimerization/phospho-acceptor domain-containing protein, partial [Pseudomonadota bacterium]
MSWFASNSLTIRLVLVLLGALGVSQAINTALGAYLKRDGFDRLMIAEASEQYALQIVGLAAAPDADLPLATARPLSGSDQVARGAESLFAALDLRSDASLEATLRQNLQARGHDPLELRAVYIEADIYDKLEVLSDERLGGPKPPMVTLIAGRFAGIEGWVNARLRSSPPPPPISFQDVAVDFATVGGIGLVGLLVVISQVRAALRSLRDAAEQVGPSGLSRSVPAQGPTEFHAVFDAFNRMTRRVQELLTEKDVMLGAIGHDLRTPLTSLRLQIEKMEPGEQRDRAVETLETTAALLDDILELARSGSTERPGRPFDIGAIVTDVVLDAQDRGQDVQVAVHGRVIAPCRPDSLRRAVQ